jgi:hypothetical protein
MGWTGGKLPHGTSFSAKAALEFEFPESDLVSRVVACSRLGNVVYAAVRGSAVGEGVWGLVLLCEREDGMLWTKPIDETMGPSEAHCPAKILDLLSPTTNEHALDWRKACRENLLKKAMQVKISAGTTICFAQPLMFRDDVARDTFTRLDDKKNLWRAEDGTRVRLAPRKDWGEFRIVPTFADDRAGVI